MLLKIITYLISMKTVKGEYLLLILFFFFDKSRKMMDITKLFW